MVDLIRDGLAAASAERMVAGGKSIEIARVKITDAAGGRLQRTIHNKTEEEEKKMKRPGIASTVWFLAFVGVSILLFRQVFGVNSTDKRDDHLIFAPKKGSWRINSPEAGSLRGRQPARFT